MSETDFEEEIESEYLDIDEMGDVHYRKQLIGRVKYDKSCKQNSEQRNTQDKFYDQSVD